MLTLRVLSECCICYTRIYSILKPVNKTLHSLYTRFSMLYILASAQYRYDYISMRCQFVNCFRKTRENTFNSKCVIFSDRHIKLRLNIFNVICQEFLLLAFLPFTGPILFSATRLNAAKWYNMAQHSKGPQEPRPPVWQPRPRGQSPAGTPQKKSFGHGREISPSLQLAHRTHHHVWVLIWAARLNTYLRKIDQVIIAQRSQTYPSRCRSIQSTNSWYEAAYNHWNCNQLQKEIVF